MSAAPANLLILSDLHLGDDLRPGIGYLRHVVKLERELEAFLAHYTVERRGELPWRLVINGDMVDFLGICLLPTEEELREAAYSADEARFGVGSHPRAARAKMHRVLDRHTGVFKALAAFIAAGNRLDIVVGNHDAEFNFPEVQAIFREGVAALTPEGADRAAVADSIAFHPWFYFEENVAWVEHGHQYDAYCSFDYVLQPANDEGIVMNVAAAVQRYVTNHTGGMIEGQETWSVLGYLRWGASLGLRGLGHLAYCFFTACAQLIAAWRRFRSPEAVAKRREAHRASLKELADRFALGEETLLAVDALRREPAVYNLGRLLGAVMLDKLLLGVVTVLVVLALPIALPWTWALGGLVGTVGVATVTSSLLARSRVPVDAGPAILLATQQLRQRVPAKFFVFGHTHDAQALPLGGGGWLFNTGTWVQHDGVPAERAFTHVMIRQDEAAGPRAALCRWQDGQSLEVKSA